MSLYVIEGPCGMGNMFGSYRAEMLPAERWAVVEDGEYTNGGNGPSTVDGLAYKSREAAEAAMAKAKQTEAAQ